MSLPAKVFRAETWGKRRGRLWTEEEEARAVLMRFFKQSDEEIAKALGRTQKAIRGKIGYWKKRR
jgi:hypothetical protein